MLQAKVVTKVVKQYVKGDTVACPTDQQIKLAAVAASRATYRNIPPSYTTGNCGCPEDLMDNGLPCRHRVATWVLCTPDQVDKLAPNLVHDIRAKLPPECRS